MNMAHVEYLFINIININIIIIIIIIIISPLCHGYGKSILFCFCDDQTS
jgi:hypothetical protein